MTSFVSPSIMPGQRASLLAALLADKIPVESGFVVASFAFDAFVEHNGISALLDTTIAASPVSTQKDVQQLSRDIRKKILSGEFPEDIAEQITRMYVSLGEPRVMLFPSFLSSGSDNPLYTEMESYFFGYEGDANLFEGIKEVWSHFFDPKPLFYRMKGGKNHLSIPFSICVQKQPKYKTTALVYTDDPTAHTKQTTLIKSVHGEGALIHELEGADYYWVKRGSGEIYNNMEDIQHEETVLAHGRSHTQRLSSTLRQKRKLSTTQVASIAAIAHKVQNHFFFPQILLIGCTRDRCSVIDTKPFTAQTNAPTYPVITQPVGAPPAIKVPEPQSIALVGVMHQLTAASHIPAVVKIEGHLGIDPKTFLHEYPKELSSSKKQTLHHQLTHSLEFLASHSYAHRGLLYTFHDALENPDVTSAQIEGILDLHRKHPALPICILTRQSTFENYQKMVAVWQRQGLPRSSQIAYANLIATPDSLYRIPAYTQVGIDYVVVDIDALHTAVHGGDHPGSSESDALMDLLKKSIDNCRSLGLSLIFQCTHAPTRAMLEAIQTSLPIEWLTTAQTAQSMMKK